MDFMFVDLKYILKLCIFNLENKIHCNKPFLYISGTDYYIFEKDTVKNVIDVTVTHVTPCFVTEVTQVVFVNTFD